MTNTVVWPVGRGSRAAKAQLAAHLGVERAERLVEQQHARLDRQRPGERDALALAARELARVALLEARELDEIEQRQHAFADLGRVGRPRGAGATFRPKAMLSNTSCGGTARSAGTRSRRCAPARRAGASSPPKSTRPSVGHSRPAMMRSSVVLPEPDGPSSASSSPAPTSSETPCSAGGLNRLHHVLDDPDAPQAGDWVPISLTAFIWLAAISSA